MNKKFFADVSLFAVAIVWGYTFVAIKDALVSITPFNFIAMRFVISLLLLCLIFRKSLREITRKELRGGMMIGIFLFFAYAFQTVGLRYTTASNAGFITGFSVVLVPVFSALILRTRPESESIAGVILASAGLFLLSYNGSFFLNKGDLLVLLCAICVAFHIITVGYYSGKSNAVRITIVQIAVVTILSFVCAIVFEKPQIPSGSSAWSALLVTSIFATVGAYLVQNTMQRFTSPTHTALIFTGEPVFAGIFGYWLLGEQLAATATAGCALILAGMCISELKIFSRE
ncbi:MAG TPA: DMT family transporter [Spirochaetota bacterium]|nr:DMT family transporter [Spirochaetota bacterium]HQO40558.1 DMT family transporter [Spirochaetota bacterium]